MSVIKRNASKDLSILNSGSELSDDGLQDANEKIVLSTESINVTASTEAELVHSDHQDSLSDKSNIVVNLLEIDDGDSISNISNFPEHWSSQIAGVGNPLEIQTSLKRDTPTAASVGNDSIPVCLKKSYYWKMNITYL